MMSRTRNSIVLILAIVMVAIGLQIVTLSDSYAFGATYDSVKDEIKTLSEDPTSYKASDRSRVEGIQADYQSLSAEDQAALDNDVDGTSQPLGRVLESALWAVWSYDSLDNSTTLADGTYDASTTPALSSEYSKGKSTSSRQRPWSVKSVTVNKGKATATITVESTSYSGMWMGGVTYPQTNTSGNCEFANVPIDLNSTFYFAGLSTSMPRPIAFSLTATIKEPAAPTPVDPTPVDPTPVDPTPVDPAPSDSDIAAAKEAANTALQVAAGYTEADYTPASVAAIASSSAALQETLKGSDLTSIQTATKALNDAVASAVEKTETTITVSKKTTQKTFKAGSKKLKTNKSFTVKATASSGAKLMYVKDGKWNKKITLNKNGKITLKKGLKKGKYTVKVKAAAGDTDEAKAAEKTFKVTVSIK